MNSLILAATMALTSPTTISDLDNTQALNTFVDTQVEKVSWVVNQQTRQAATDTYLLQAKLAMNATDTLVFKSTSLMEAE